MVRELAVRVLEPAPRLAQRAHRIGSLQVGTFGGEQPVAPVPFLVVMGIAQHQKRQFVQRQGDDLVGLKSPCAIHTGILPDNINVVRDDSPRT